MNLYATVVKPYEYIQDNLSAVHSRHSSTIDWDRPRDRRSRKQYGPRSGSRVPTEITFTVNAKAKGLMWSKVALKDIKDD